MGGGWKRGLAVVGVFAVVGPLVGTAALAVWLLILMAQTGATGENPLMAFVGLAVFGYLMGGAPALFTGTVAALLSRRLAGMWPWLIVAVGTGALASGAFGWIAFPRADWSHPEAWRAIMLMAGLGAVAAFICALLTRNLRPKP